MAYTPVLVYLITGFLDSGKSSLIKSTLNDPDFMADGNKSLILCMEQGEIEFEEDYLKDKKAEIEYFDSCAELDTARMMELDQQYQPNQVFIEWDGMTPVIDLLNQRMPQSWQLIQIITTIDASSFNLYITNMRSIMYETARFSDLIIFNRCSEDTKKSMLRGNIKAINRAAQIIYEDVNGNVNQLADDDLPFDLNAAVIDINDDDYGLWYMDAAENPPKYDGKKVRLRGRYAQQIPGYHQSFILGRNAMVCCEQDTSLIGITVTGVKIDQMQLNDWVEVEGTIKTIDDDYGRMTCVLYAESIRFYEKPEDEYVYFS